MKKIMSLLLTVFVLLGCKTANGKLETAKSQIYVNQVGYLPDEDKYFMVDSYNGGFNVLDSSNTVVYSGTVEEWKLEDDATEMNLSKGDFTSIGLIGTFKIQLDDGSESYPFKIDNNVFKELRNQSIKTFYLQRASVELKEEHAGRFKRPAGHTQELAYHKSVGISGKKDVSGGWYDAGDYGRYVGPEAVTMGVMMLGYERFPEKYNYDDNNIPESGNGISDFLDEMRVGLEWMLKMQYHGEGEFNGALPWMINELDYTWEMPHKVTNPNYIYDFSSVTSADFAAIMANASRNYKEIDPGFSSKCLDAAKLAWDFAVKNPDYPEGGFLNPSDTYAGGYGLNKEYNKTTIDDRTWAAVELYLTTGDETYHNAAKDGLYEIMDEWWVFNWIDMSSLARIQYILADDSIIDIDLKEMVQKRFIDYCNYLVGVSRDDGFKNVLENWGYYWGSNSLILANAQMLVLAYEITEDKSFYDTALYQLNYILGLNGVNYSYVAGFGTVYPENIHHAITENDDTYGSYPGLVVPGPNMNINDDYALTKYFTEDTPPALCYVDDVDSYSTNENCLIFNAQLVTLSAYFTE